MDEQIQSVTPEPVAGRDFEYAPADPATVFRAAPLPEWLVEGILRADGAAMIGAPKKCYATWTAVDLALGLANGKPVLNHFPVSRPCKVAYVTAPTRRPEVAEKVRAVCAAKEIDPCANGIDWLFAVPDPTSPPDLDRLATGLCRSRTRAVIFDPTFYLFGRYPELSAANVYEYGAALEVLVGRCLDAGATPVFLHHARKDAGRFPARKPLELEEVTFSGLGEVCRQWLLLNRASEFEPTSGRQELNLAIGTSTGYRATWRVIVTEKRTGAGQNPDWVVRVEPPVCPQRATAARRARGRTATDSADNINSTAS